MDDRAENRNSRATTKFSRLDWPTPDMLHAAGRSRGKALRSMILALVKWARNSTENHSISKPSRDMVNTDALTFSSKH